MSAFVVRYDDVSILVAGYVVDSTFVVSIVEFSASIVG